MSTTPPTKIKRDRKRAKTGESKPFVLQPKHETFCQGIVAGLSQRDAYIGAGWTSQSSASGPGPHMLLKKPAIQHRIAVLQALQRGRLNITMETLLLELEDERQGAIKAENWNAAVTATMAKAKLLGLLVDKAAIDVNLIPMPSDKPLEKVEYSVEEWIAEFSPKQITHLPDGRANTSGSNGHG